MILSKNASVFPPIWNKKMSSNDTNSSDPNLVGEKLISPMSEEEKQRRRERKQRKKNREEKRLEKAKKQKSEKTKKLLIYLGGAAVLLGGLGSIVYSPYYQTNKLSEHLEKNEIQEVGAFVDEKAISENMKDRFKAKMEREISENKNNGQFTWLGAEMTPIVFEREIYKYSRPEAIVKTIANGELTPYDGNYQKETSSLKLSTKKYIGVNQFQVAHNGVVLTFNRNGIFGWKIINIQ